MKDTDFLIIMLAKLLDVLERRGTERDGNWGYHSFKEEISEMKEEIFKHPAVKNAAQTAIFI